MELKNKMYLVLGDQEGTGHLVTYNVVLQSNASVMVVQKAYKDSCRLTGVTFNKGRDFTGKGVSTQEESPYMIACNDGNARLSKLAFDLLARHGLTVDLLQGWDETCDEADEFKANPENGFGLYTQTFVYLWVWFTSLSLPKGAILQYNPNSAGIPKINDCDKNALDVQFGYSLM